tara:strand:- start:75 stop:614 length:540 start_codon:yes stop_codon:yes gene_type:complete
MNNDLLLIKEVIIENPPTFYQIKQVKNSKAAGEDIYTKYYLTANLFFNNATSFHVISKIVQECKLYLRDKIGYLPPLEKIRLEIEIHASKHIDLDNRAYFWKKLLLDILKTPTSKQLLKESKKDAKFQKEIVTLNVIHDDTTQYIDDIHETFEFGGNQLIFRIYGRAKSEQKKLDLFFK